MSVITETQQAQKEQILPKIPLQPQKNAKCRVCYDEIMETAPKQCVCGQDYCESCLSSWYIEQTLNVSFNSGSTLTCPTPTCKGKIPSETAINSQITTPKNAEAMGLSLLKVYLRSQNDVRMCPSPFCNYAGTIQQDSNCVCGEFVCESCGTHWSDGPQKTPLGAKLTDIHSWSAMFNTLLSTFYSMTLTEQCPNCSIHMIRSSGCPHMTCGNCTYQFCWNCKHDHDGKDHNKLLCNVTLATKITLLAMVLITFLINSPFVIIFQQIFQFARLFAVYGIWLQGTLLVAYFFLRILVDNLLNFQPQPLVPRLIKVAISLLYLSIHVYSVAALEMLRFWLSAAGIEGILLYVGYKFYQMRKAAIQQKAN